MSLYDCYRLRYNTELESLEMNVGAEDWEPIPAGSGGDVSAHNLTLDGQLVQDTTYADAPSFQGLAGDTTLDATAGRDKGDGGAFLAAIMGNIHGSTLTKTGNFVAGVIGAYDIQSTNASELPKAAVLGSIFDSSTTADGIVVAEIDGSDPSGVTRAGAAFKARQLNTNAGSGVDYGVDLHDTAVSGYMSSPTLPLAIAKADIRTASGACIMTGAGVPTDGTTGDNFAEKGSLYIDITNGKLYIQGGAITSPAWKIVTSA